MRTLMEMVDTFSYDTEDKQRIIHEIGQRIAEARIKNKITTGELADLCNLSESCLYNTEKGKTNISVTNLIAICLALGCSLDDMIPPELYNPDYKTRENNIK